MEGMEFYRSDSAEFFVESGSGKVSCWNARLVVGQTIRWKDFGRNDSRYVVGFFCGNGLEYDDPWEKPAREIFYPETPVPILLDRPGRIRGGAD